MRLNFRLTGNTEPVLPSYLSALRSAVHRWLGPNDLHDGLSLYSFSTLYGGRWRGSGPVFRNGAVWRLSFADACAARRASAGVLGDPHVAFGMRVYEVAEQAPPSLGSVYRFEADSPVLVRAKRQDETREHLAWDDPRADDALTHVLRRKLRAAGFDGEHLQARAGFDRSYRGAKTKVVEVQPGLRYKGNVCPVIIAGTPEAVRFSWLVGAGDLTGSGMGALRGPVPPDFALPTPIRYADEARPATKP